MTQRFTYSIYDTPPEESGYPWPSADEVEIEAESEDAADEHVRSIMRREAARHGSTWGMRAGQRIYANVWDVDGIIVRMPSYTLTEKDVGGL